MAGAVVVPVTLSAGGLGGSAGRIPAGPAAGMGASPMALQLWSPMAICSTDLCGMCRTHKGVARGPTRLSKIHRARTHELGLLRESMSIWGLLEWIATSVTNHCRQNRHGDTTTVTRSMTDDK